MYLTVFIAFDWICLRKQETDGLNQCWVDFLCCDGERFNSCNTSWGDFLLDEHLTGFCFNESLLTCWRKVVYMVRVRANRGICMLVRYNPFDLNQQVRTGWRGKGEKVIAWQEWNAQTPNIYNLHKLQFLFSLNHFSLECGVMLFMFHLNFNC